MSFKSKFLNIITFGYVNRKAKKEAKKAAENKNTELKVNTIELPNVQVLVDSLGGKTNIHQMSNTISTITFKLEDHNKLDEKLLKTITTKGIIKSSHNVTLIVGDCAKALRETIEEFCKQ